MKKNTNKIIIRSYKIEDAAFLAAIYFHTIHNINVKDYSSEQVNAWAPVSSLETEGWIKKWQKVIPIVAVLDNQIMGFAEFEENGHIDCFYCHHEHQGCGIGSALMNAIKNKARKNNISRIFAEVSITASGSAILTNPHQSVL